MSDRTLVERLGHIWRFGLRPGSAGAFGFALLCVAAATLARILTDLIKPGIVTHVTFFPAMLLATLIGGTSAGVLVMVLGAVIIGWAFEPRYLDLVLASPERASDLVLYLVSSAIIIGAADRYRRVVWRLDEAEQYRKLVVSELGHRVKNKLATVYAIVGYELRHRPEIWDVIDGRLRALAATDELVTRSDGRGATILDILKAEFAPYGSDRVALNGEAIEVPEKLAVTLALIFHELATNAAKYGALSTPNGRLGTSWSRSGNRVAIAWNESGGPAAAEPVRWGFGKRLLERGLDPFQGTVEMRFAPTGFVCTITFALTEERPMAVGNAPLAPFPTAQR